RVGATRASEAHHADIVIASGSRPGRGGGRCRCLLGRRREEEEAVIGDRGGTRAEVRSYGVAQTPWRSPPTPTPKTRT
ncbi:unnamed protein product, partial [Ectocarpus sp. 12 AP-2014]